MRPGLLVSAVVALAAGVWLAPHAGSGRGSQRSTHQVVENPAPDPNTPAYRLSAEPVLVVGGLNDDERYEILRFADATLSPSGHLIVATGGGRGSIPRAGCWERCGRRPACACTGS